MRLLLFFLLPLMALGQTRLIPDVIVLPKSDDSATGELRLFELGSNGANYVGFRSPPALAADSVWTLPDSDGSPGQYIQTDGANNLSFADGGHPAVSGTTLARGEGDSAPEAYLRSYGDSLSDTFSLRIGRGRGSSGSPADVYSSMVLGRLGFDAYYSSAWNTLADINAVVTAGATSAFMYFGIAGTNIASVSGYGFLPAQTKTYNLGGGNALWDEFHVYNGFVYGDLRPADIGLIIEHDLGSAFDPWDEIHAADIYLGGTLHLGPDGFDPATVIMVGEATQANAYLEQYTSSPTGAPSFVFRKARGTQASPTATIDNDVLGKFVFSGRDSGGAWDTAVWFQAEADVSGSAVRGDIGFYTISGGVLKLWNDGTVSIGVATDSSERLYVSGNARVTSTLEVDGLATLDSGLTLTGLFTIGGGSTYVDGSLYPYTGGADSLGGGGARWDVWGDDINATNLTVANVASDLIPVSVGDIGSSSKPWWAIYVGIINNGGSVISITDPAQTRDVDPATNKTYDLGSSSLRYSTVFADSIDLSDSGTCVAGRYSLIAVNATEAVFCVNGTTKNVTYD